MNTFAYIRVSTKDQNTDRQFVAIEPYNIPNENIYVDYQSGKDFERPEYKKLMKNLKEGDLLIIKSIDRLGRNYNEILTQWQNITKVKKANIVVIDMSLLDTRSKNGDLTGTLIADLVLQILAYVAQTERDNIKQRQAEGIAAAKAKGKKFGRPKTELPNGFDDCCMDCILGNLTIRQAAKRLGMSSTTFYRKFMEFKNI